MSKISDDIIRYIENEKDLSRYKISRLEKKKDISASNRRILEIEQEFLDLPLENMSFEDVADVASAIQIYRQSRMEFYKTYKLEFLNEEKQKKKVDSLLDAIDSKIKFLEIQSKEWTSNRIEEVNLIQNSELHHELIKIESKRNQTSLEYEKRRLGMMSFAEISKLEPATMAKHRARMQSTIFSIGQALAEILQNISLKMVSDDLFDSQKFFDLNLNLPNNEIIFRLESYNQSIDFEIDNLLKKAFKYYNSSLLNLKSKTINTLGRNEFANKIHSLKNLIDFNSYQPNLSEYPKPLCISQEKYSAGNPQLGNIMFSSKRVFCQSLEQDRAKCSKNKVFGILFPLPRTGNEKTTLLYADVWIYPNLCLNPLLSEQLSNVKALNENNQEEYFKALMIAPAWQIIGLNNSSRFDNLISKLIFENASYSKYDIDKINEYQGNFIDIDKNISQVLIPKTRSEEESFESILPWAKSKIIEFQEDYRSI